MYFSYPIVNQWCDFFIKIFFNLLNPASCFPFKNIKTVHTFLFLVWLYFFFFFKSKDWFRFILFFCSVDAKSQNTLTLKAAQKAMILNYLLKQYKQ